MNPIVSQYFDSIVTGPDEDINLAEAVLHIALNEYPQLDTGSYLLKLDAMAAELAPRIHRDLETESLVDSLNDYLFNKQGFSGNWRDFNDPRNSFLNDVIDRKLGIPISLSLIYMEVGKRLGLSMHGVSFPGHFLVKLSSEEEKYIIDPFSGGKILEAADLVDRLKHISGNTDTGWKLDEFVRSASNKDILMRVLRNLKYVYIELKDFQQALPVTNLQLILEPESLDGLLDRARIFEGLDCYRAASDDYQHYLGLNPEAGDYQQIQTRLTELQQSINRLH